MCQEGVRFHKVGEKFLSYDGFKKCTCKRDPGFGAILFCEVIGKPDPFSFCGVPELNGYIGGVRAKNLRSFQNGVPQHNSFNNAGDIGGGVNQFPQEQNKWSTSNNNNQWQNVQPSHNFHHGEGTWNAHAGNSQQQSTNNNNNQWQNTQPQHNNFNHGETTWTGHTGNNHAPNNNQATNNNQWQNSQANHNLNHEGLTWNAATGPNQQPHNNNHLVNNNQQSDNNNQHHHHQQQQPFDW